MFIRIQQTFVQNVVPPSKACRDLIQVPCTVIARFYCMDLCLFTDLLP